MSAALLPGLLSLGTLLLGLLGGLHPWVVRALLLGVGLWAARRIPWGGLKTLRLDGLGLFHAALATLLVVPMAAGLLVLPSDYDALEYHLGAPAAYVRQGKISRLPDDRYASMPANQEMLYLLGLAATGSQAAGAAAAKGINLAFWLLAAWAVLDLGRRHGSARAGAWGALALLASPWVLLTGGWLVYNEPGLALYSTLAFAAAFDAWKNRARKEALLSGILAGLAFGTKYPAALFLILPLAAVLEFRRLALPFALGALLTASPWLAKNLIETGNPVFPLLAGDAKWDAAHAPGAMDLAALWNSLGNLGSGMLVAPALLVFLLFGWKREEGRTFRKAVLLWAGLGVLLWFACTHRVDRFCLPFLPLVCLAVGFGVEAIEPWVGRSVMTAVVLLSAGEGLRMAAEALPKRDNPWKGSNATYSPEAIAAVNALPAGSRVLFVGEAETFYVRLDGRVKVLAPTVFDEKPLDLRGFTHVYVNLPELHRLQSTYGDRVHGYSEMITDEILEGLETSGKARRIWQAGGGRWRILAL